MPTFVKLFHTTGNYGKVIPVPTRSNDADIGVPAVWTMVVPQAKKSGRKGKGKGDDETGSDPCCKHHTRIVSLPQAQFVDWAGEERDSQWSLFFVWEAAGEARGHTFYKYVLFCTSAGSSPLRACKDWKKYKEEFSGVKPRELFSRLGQIWDDWSFGDGKSGQTNHFHIGILGATAFSQYTDENEAEWRELRPDLPMVHRRDDEEAEDGAEQSEAESLSESEIFRRFAFEIDENDCDGAWSVVKPKHKAADGCLPFCFDPDRHIFPDHDGVFRHYCRAEVIWQCRRKTCKRTPAGSSATAQPRASKDGGEGAGEGEARTSWRSACSWYHEHLKDKETQGLRKGFERQFCGECWKNSHERVEGQICKFFKPGTFALEDDTGGKRGQHNPDICEVCQRLRDKGFDEGCTKFTSYLAKGKVKVEPGATGWTWA